MRLYFERGFASIEAINTFVLFLRHSKSKGGRKEGEGEQRRVYGGSTLGTKNSGRAKARQDIQLHRLRVT